MAPPVFVQALSLFLHHLNHSHRSLHYYNKLNGGICFSFLEADKETASRPPQIKHEKKSETRG